jgi:threonine aldolase
MTNQIALNILTRPGDEVICHKHSHVYFYEGGGMMKNSGVSVCLIDGNRGMINAEDVLNNINSDDVHRPHTSTVAIENTTNKGGGAYYRFEEIIKISEVCKQNGLKLHLDGARLFNSIVETGDKPEDYGKLCDTISICLSKGLGAPVGSLLLSNQENINRARRVRKLFGGGMRQSGYLAAAGIYAFENNIERLKEDHKRASYLTEFLKNFNYVEHVLPCDTNILIFTLTNKYTENEFLAKLFEQNIHALPIAAQTIRFVTHLDFTDEMLMKVEDVLRSFN